MDDYLPAPSLAELNAQLPSDHPRWPELVACPVCDSPDLRRFAVLRSIAHDRCRACGFTFANPYPPETVRAAFYDSDFYTNYRRLEDARRRHDPYFSASAYREARALAEPVTARAPGSILDYGCGTGSFLAYLRDVLGYHDVEGFEISSEARERARQAYGLEVAGDLRELRRTEYEFVVLQEVIEHVPDPVELFAEIAALVRPGGLVMITTPAVDNLLGRYFPRHCLHYTAPSHVSLFTTRAMEVLLERFSFHIEELTTDPACQVLRTLVQAPLHALDFASPQHDDDTNDALYRPTTVGRRAGHTACRVRQGPSGVISKAITFADMALERLVPRPNHLYVVARRVGRR